MSADPQMIQQMLTQQLQQRPVTPINAPPGAAAPQIQGQFTPGAAAAQIIQKAMLMKALQNQQQGNSGPLTQMRANNALPRMNAAMANDPQMQQLPQQTQDMMAQNPQLQQLQQPPPLPPPQQLPIDPSAMLGPP